MTERIDEFLEEIQQDIRQEKFLKLWQRYGKLVIGVGVAIVLTVSTISLWQTYDRRQRLQMAEKFIAAQDLIAQNQIAKALSVLTEYEKEANKSYSLLERFQKAALLAYPGEGQNMQAAISAYHELAADSKLEVQWRDLATLLEVMLLIDAAEQNKKELDTNDLISRLSILTEEGNPWKLLALEIKGMIFYLTRDKVPGNFDKAANVFVSLVQDPKSPEGVGMRAQLMTQALASEKIRETDKKSS